MNTMDRHQNINATEGMDVCVCGCKYWENDRCIDCGTLIEIARIRTLASDSKILLRVKMNSQFATMVYYRLPWLKDAPITDLQDII